MKKILVTLLLGTIFFYVFPIQETIHELINNLEILHQDLIPPSIPAIKKQFPKKFLNVGIPLQVTSESINIIDALRKAGVSSSISALLKFFLTNVKIEPIQLFLFQAPFSEQLLQEMKVNLARLQKASVAQKINTVQGVFSKEQNKLKKYIQENFYCKLMASGEFNNIIPASFNVKSVEWDSVNNSMKFKIEYLNSKNLTVTNSKLQKALQIIFGSELNNVMPLYFFDNATINIPVTKKPTDIQFKKISEVIMSEQINIKLPLVMKVSTGKLSIKFDLTSNAYKSNCP